MDRSERTHRGARLPATAVARPRLEARLDEATLRRLTVVCAPAGSGKSFLLAAWSRSAPAPVAWLALDDVERAGPPFWTAVAEALRTIDGLDEVAPTHDAVADALSRHEDSLVLVVDDAHLLGEPNPLATLLPLPRPPPRRRPRCRARGGSSPPPGTAGSCRCTGCGWSTSWPSCAATSWRSPATRPGRC